MSHLTTIKTKFRSLDGIKAAVKRMGGTFHENQTTFNWYGHWVGDTSAENVRAQFATEHEWKTFQLLDRNQQLAYMTNKFSRCDHAISLPGTDKNYQIGVVRHGDEYIPVWDNWDGGLHKIMGDHGHALAQAYAVETAKLEAELLGHTCEEQLLADGSIQLLINTY